jgi:hypothetical protein
LYSVYPFLKNLLGISNREPKAISVLVGWSLSYCHCKGVSILGVGYKRVKQNKKDHLAHRIIVESYLEKNRGGHWYRWSPRYIYIKVLTYPNPLARMNSMRAVSNVRIETYYHDYASAMASCYFMKSISSTDYMMHLVSHSSSSKIV